jgi:hypothetical protein
VAAMQSMEFMLESPLVLEIFVEEDRETD